MKKNLIIRNLYKDIKYLTNIIYDNYLEQITQLATSMFEWENAPSSMDTDYLEECLFENGKSFVFKDDNEMIINSKCTGTGQLNKYYKHTIYQCTANNYNTTRFIYNGEINESINEKTSGVLIKNNKRMKPTFPYLEVYAWQLTNADLTIQVNLNAQKTPITVAVDKDNENSLKNAYKQFSGNEPVIFANKKETVDEWFQAINTQAPYIEDKITKYKKEVWNEILTFLGINNIQTEKKERLISDEANQNNEMINYNLQSKLIPRKKACEQINELFQLSEDKKINVKINSDLYNIIKNTENRLGISKNNLQNNENLDIMNMD